jgi:hypothetical protein
VDASCAGAASAGTSTDVLALQPTTDAAQTKKDGTAQASKMDFRMSALEAIDGPRELRNVLPDHRAFRGPS